MTLPSEGIAHVSFAGDGLFLPARNTRDRQTLSANVAAHARAMGQVQVLLNGDRWLVYAIRRPWDGDCAGCRQAVDVVCSLTGDTQRAYCVGCAFGRLDQGLVVRDSRLLPGLERDVSARHE